MGSSPSKTHPVYEPSQRFRDETERKQLKQLLSAHIPSELVLIVMEKELLNNVEKPPKYLLGYTQDMVPPDDVEISPTLYKMIKIKLVESFQIHPDFVMVVRRGITVNYGYIFQREPVTVKGEPNKGEPAKGTSKYIDRFFLNNSHMFYYDPVKQMCWIYQKEQVFRLFCSDKGEIVIDKNPYMGQYVICDLFTSTLYENDEVVHVFTKSVNVDKSEFFIL